MEGELIYVTFISGIFGIIMVSLLNHNWFKKEVFKVNRDFDKQSNRLKLKKLEADLGLETKKKAGGGLDLPNLLKTFSGLPNEDKQDLIDTFLGGAGDEGGEDQPWWADLIPSVMEGLNKTEAGQKVIKSFLGGGKGGAAGPDQGPGSQV